ncbi:MAG: hypothetical protein DRI65_12715 [Chloroflexota bacterium]|nr:MAG: hypothetical protein DRI65_12715 [Chloroflexota bacterium]
MGSGEERRNEDVVAKGPKFITFTNTYTSYQMLVSDHILSVTSGTGEDATGIVTLPAVGEAIGKFYFIVAPTGATGNDVSIYEKETGAEYAGFDSDDGDLDADDDHILLFSDGSQWRTIFNGVA